MTEDDDADFKLRDPIMSGSHLLDEDDAVVLRNLARALSLRREPVDVETCRWLASVIASALEGMSRRDAELALERIGDWSAQPRSS